MKDGTVAETGTHEELMLKNGKYAELYNIQASAFSADASTEGETKSEVSTFPSSYIIRTSLNCDPRRTQTISTPGLQGNSAQKVHRSEIF